jgi:DNA-binding CsgD family transcriptional regulator
MGRVGVRVGGTRWVDGRRPPITAGDRHAEQALVSALPALACLRLLDGGSSPSEVHQPRPSASLSRGELRRLLAALDRAVEAIAAPALVLARDGQILHANSIARATLGANADAVPRPGPVALPKSAKHFTEGGPGASGWDVTPLGRSGETFGFLAILHRPAPGEALGASLAAATRTWKLTTRQGEILEQVTRGLTNALIADTLGITKVTVECHLSAIFDKAGVCNRTMLMARVLEVGRR